MRVQENLELGDVFGRIQNVALPALLLSVVITLVWGAIGFGWLDFTVMLLGFLALPLVALVWVNMWVSYSRFSAAERAWSTVIGQTLATGLRLHGVLAVEGRAKKPKAMRDRMVLRMAALAHAVRGELRGVHALDDLADLLDEAEFNRIRGAVVGTTHLLASTRVDVQEAQKDERLSASDATALQDLLDQLLQSIYRCRGLSSTHAPPILTRAVPMITNGFCVFLPLGLVTTTGWLTPVATVLVCLVYLLPNAIASALSVPFGAHPDCLPLYRDSRHAETTLRAALGQDALPRTFEPFGGVIR